ncbi:MAG: TonB family protein [Tenuifilaceae bacterium]
MNNLLIYLLSAGLCLSLFVLAFQIFLKDNTRFNLCRFYLITSILLSFLIPSIPIDLGINSYFAFESKKVVQPVVEKMSLNIDQVIVNQSHIVATKQLNIDPYRIIGITILSISILLLLRFIYRFGSIFLIQLSGRRLETDDGINLIFTDKTDNAFSFLGNVFINPLKFTDEEKRLIIDHEREHIRNFHSIDLILIELLIVVQWFNPFAYIARRKLIEIHEFIADNGVIQKGADPYSYQNLLLSVVTSSCLQSAGNQLSALITKKRIAMIGKSMNQSGKWVNFLILIPVAALLIIGVSAFSPKENKIEISKSKNELLPINNKDTTLQDRIQGEFGKLQERSWNNIDVNKGGILSNFFADLTTKKSNAYSVILKKDKHYKIYYYSTNPNDKLYAKVESVEKTKDLFFSYSGIITFTSKIDGVHQLKIENLSSNKTNALIVLTLEETGETAKAEPSEQKVMPENEVFTVVEQMPSFGGGDANEFKAWVAANMKYPKVAAENGIQGKVFVQFVIEADGSLTNAKILRSVDPALDKEALRIVQSSPKWNHGMQRGKTVRVQFTFPIEFTLKNTKATSQDETPPMPKIDTLNDKIVKEQEITDEEVFLVVEKMPNFGGGDPNEFRAYVAANLQYPKIAIEKGIQGRVFVQYVVEADGSITNVKILRGVDPILDKEAIRVVESSPKWNPGMQRGKAVRVQFTFPITFVLGDSENKSQPQKTDTEKTISKEEDVFTVVEQVPTFGSGDPNEFRTWVAANMKYPKVASDNGIQGKVYVQFVIEADGSLTNAKILRSVDPALDKEALRIVQSSPKWNPGMQKGKPVKVQFTFPIAFIIAKK